MNIQPTYVTFQQAKLLKEKAFRVQCLEWFDKDGNPPPNKFAFIRSSEYEMKDIYLQPEQWQVVEWLRVKHGIIIELLVDGWKDDNCVSEEFLCYRIFIWQIGKPKPHYNDDLGALPTLQEAYSVAFDYILKELI
jgi:hypothetical protein